VKTYIINLETEPERWESTAQHFANYGCEPIRWSATTPDGIEVDEWNGINNVPDKERRIAIVRTYRNLLRFLDDTHEIEWLIVQDDVRLSRDPYRPSGSDIHLYGGYVLRRYATGADGFSRPIPGTEQQVDPLARRTGLGVVSAKHVCPKAFRLNRDAIPDLYDAWRDETRQVCESWTPHLTRATTSYDRYPTVEP
jgi:hypothetical protein